jgi:hypothetical protein
VASLMLGQCVLFRCAPVTATQSGWGAASGEVVEYPAFRFVNFSLNAVDSWGIAFMLRVRTGKADAQFLTVVGGSGYDVFHAYTNDNVSLAWSNIVDTEQHSGVVFVFHLTSVTTHRVEVRGCHFVNVENDEYCDLASDATFCFDECIFDGPIQTDLYVTYKDCQELTDMPTLGLPQVLLSCAVATPMPCGGDKYDGFHVQYTDTSIPPEDGHDCLTVTNSEFLFCRKVGVREDGGAICVAASGPVQIMDSLFYVCTVSVDGFACGGAIGDGVGPWN